MTDRELLEKAAKAAGIELQWKLGMGQCTMPPAHPFYLRGGLDVTWNPLADDGDALRLAVKLRLCLFLELPRIGIGPMINGPEAYVEDGEDEMAATRRAIVRAASAIGDAQ